MVISFIILYNEKNNNKTVAPHSPSLSPVGKYQIVFENPYRRVGSIYTETVFPIYQTVFENPYSREVGSIYTETVSPMYQAILHSL